jgi:bla regulator protein blaR1
MNYVILIGIALFFVVTAVRNGATGWDFNDHSMNFRVGDGDYSLSVKSDGDVDLEVDGSGVASLDRGGSFDVRMRRNGVDRRALFTSDDDGTIERKFFVEGKEQPWGPEADRFVEEAMPIVLRETAINAGERVAWLIDNRGQDGLLDEIALINSDFAQRVYSVEYAQKEPLIAPANFERLMKLTADNMGSDFDARTTLIEAYDAQKPTGAAFDALLGAGETIGSDFDARMVLEHVGPNMPRTPEAATAYVDLARTIGSDFDMRLALQPLITSGDADDELVARAIELAGTDIGSDFDLRSVLVESAGRVGNSDALARAYTTAASSIGSDFDQRIALTALGENAELTPEGWRMLLTTAREIGSDFDAATLLAGLVPHLPRDESVIQAYRDTLETIGSDFDRGRAAAALEGVRR